MRTPAFTLTRKSFFGSKRKVAVSRNPQQEPVGQHRHEFFEIALVRSGKATHVTGNYRHFVEAGDALVLNPHRTHGYENPQNLNLINILIRSDIVSKIGKSLGRRPGFRHLFGVESSRWRRDKYHAHIHLSLEDMERVEDWADRMEAESKRGTGAVRLVEEACLALVIDLLCERCQNQGAGALHATSSLSSKLGKLLAWIENNLQRPLLVDDLAVKMGVSERTLHRIFKEELQTTPQKYIIHSRLLKAEYLLADAARADSSITEIALACGFGDSNYFARCFHRFSGLAPRDFREQA